MKGLLQEGTKLAGQVQEGQLRDLAIIDSARKVEHYEISSYRALVEMAETLGLDDHIDLLEETLAEEKATDQKLTRLASEGSWAENDSQKDTNSKSAPSGLGTSD